MSFEKELIFFGLKRGYSMQELKVAFRRVVSKTHPDVGGIREEFERAMSFFYTLSNQCTNFGKRPDGSIIEGDKTTEGRKLVDLGKGYPITENAKTCETCDGKGYTSFRKECDHKYQVCDACNGIGLFSYPCKKCGGSGEYSRNGKIIGECNLCHGSGRFYPENKRPLRGFCDAFRYIPGTMKLGITCKKCNGHGQLWVPVVSDKLFHAVCYICDGIGEIRIFNPVLPRGLFVGANK
jgi:DnaJ-class molecular chaperone